MDAIAAVNTRSRTRYFRMKKLLLKSLALIMLVAAGAKAAGKPNLLFLFSDDMTC